MCYITATELKNNLGHYLELSKKEDIYVTKNNKIITVLTNPNNKSFEKFMSLEGVLKTNDNKDYDEIIREEIEKRWGY